MDINKYDKTFCYGNRKIEEAKKNKIKVLENINISNIKPYIFTPTIITRGLNVSLN